jgi:sugar lactone lactonase YvrE
MSGEARIADAAGALLGEGPIWVAEENAVFWVDIKSGMLNRYGLADSSVERWKIDEHLAWVVPRRDAPGFIAATRKFIGILHLHETPVFEPRLHIEETHPGNRLNDAKADHHGTIWFGTMDDAATRNSGGFYRLGHDFTIFKADHDYVIANGPTMSPDGSVIYHTDTVARTIYRFRRSADGSLQDRGVFVKFGEGDGNPDGMTTDREGGIWVAHWGGSRVTRFLPDGTRDRSIALPVSQVTSCCFAGEKLDRLFVTTAAGGLSDAALAAEPLAGGLFELNPGVAGLPPHRFAA